MPEASQSVAAQKMFCDPVFRIRGGRLRIPKDGGGYACLARHPIGSLHALVWSVALLTGCGRKETPQPPAVAFAAPVESTHLVAAESIGAPPDNHPWIAHVTTADVDQDGRTDILACDGKNGQVFWLRQTAPGAFVESVLAADLRAPVHTEVVDLDGDGDRDVLVASMGVLVPNNDKIGSVIILENDGAQHFTVRFLLENVARVTDVRAGDFNRDGRLDLAVGQFGYEQGEIRWMECTGPWQYRSHLLLDLSGTVNVCVADMNGDTTPDIVALVSQQWEEVYLFPNDGTGIFTKKVIFGSTNADFGSSGLSLCDLDRDGRPDLLYTNGDGFDLARPGPRSWHGVQWLQNAGNGYFRHRRIGDLPGAYSPLAMDFDGDGALDVVAVSCFADWSDPRAISLMLFRNNGRMDFTPHILARVPTHLLTLAPVDLGGGRPALVTGGFHAFPPYDRESRITLWRQSDAP